MKHAFYLEKFSASMECTSNWSNIFFSGAFYMELNTTILSSMIKSHEHLSHVTVTSSTTTPSAEVTNDERIQSTRKADISGDFLLSTTHIAYICNGEFGAFVVAWNLIMEFIVIVALISKALIMYIDATIYGNVGHLTQILPLAIWPFAQYFDVLALLVPIVIGGKVTFFFFFLLESNSHVL